MPGWPSSGVRGLRPRRLARFSMWGGTLRPWIAFMASAWPSTNVMPSAAQRSATQYHVNMHSTCHILITRPHLEAVRRPHQRDPSPRHRYRELPVSRSGGEVQRVQPSSPALAPRSNRRARTWCPDPGWKPPNVKCLCAPVPSTAGDLARHDAMFHQVDRNRYPEGSRNAGASNESLIGMVANLRTETRYSEDGVPSPVRPSAFSAVSRP